MRFGQQSDSYSVVNTKRPKLFLSMNEKLFNFSHFSVLKVKSDGQQFLNVGFVTNTSISLKVVANSELRKHSNCRFVALRQNKVRSKVNDKFAFDRELQVHKLLPLLNAYNLLFVLRLFFYFLLCHLVVKFRWCLQF